MNGQQLKKYGMAQQERPKPADHESSQEEPVVVTTGSILKDQMSPTIMSHTRCSFEIG